MIAEERLETPEILATEGEQVPVWDVRPFQLVSLPDMIEFEARYFFRLAQYLKWVQTLIEEKHDLDSSHPIADPTRSILTERLKDMIELCNVIGLELSVMLLEEIEGSVNADTTYNYPKFAAELKELQRRIDHEMSLHMFMVIPRNKLSFQYRTKIAL